MKTCVFIIFISMPSIAYVRMILPDEGVCKYQLHQFFVSIRKLLFVWPTSVFLIGLESVANRQNWYKLTFLNEKMEMWNDSECLESVRGLFIGTSHIYTDLLPISSDFGVLLNFSKILLYCNCFTDFEMNRSYH